MKATGIVRRIDDLGRIVIPKEIRRTLRIREGDPLEIFISREGEVIFKKYSMLGDLSQIAGQICDTLSRTTGTIVVVTDRDSCIAAAGTPRREVVDKAVSPALERLMEGRQVYQHKAGEEPLPLSEGGALYLDTAAPVLSEGDVMGCVLFVGPAEQLTGGEVTYKLAQSMAAFLGKYLEN